MPTDLDLAPVGNSSFAALVDRIGRIRLVLFAAF